MGTAPSRGASPVRSRNGEEAGTMPRGPALLLPGMVRLHRHHLPPLAPSYYSATSSASARDCLTFLYIGRSSRRRDTCYAMRYWASRRMAARCSPRTVNRLIHSDETRSIGSTPNWCLHCEQSSHTWWNSSRQHQTSSCLRRAHLES